MAKQVDATVPVELNETDGLKGLRRFGLWIPGFGNPGCIVSARNKREAKKLVAEFIGNELMNAGELGNT